MGSDHFRMPADCFPSHPFESRDLYAVYLPGQKPESCLPVVQQPSSNAKYVSEQADVLTQFRLINPENGYWLLAHNTLAGVYISAMSEGDEYMLVDTLGRVGKYRVTEIEAFQADPPDSYTPDLIPVDLDTLEPIGSSVSSDTEYAGFSGHSSKLQTCIEKGGNNSWGRLFVVGEADSVQMSLTNP